VIGRLQQKKKALSLSYIYIFIYLFIYKIALSLEQNFLLLLFKKVSGIYQIACISIELGVLIALL
jgi:hypothetical protein